MTSVLSVMAIVSCRYNSFSFTCDNIDNRMNVYSINNHIHNHNNNNNNNSTIINKYAPKLNIPDKTHTDSKDEPKTLIGNNLNLLSQEIVSSSDCESDASSVVSSDTETTQVETAEIETPDQPEIVEFDEIASFFTPKPEDSLLWCTYIMINGIEKFETVENYYTEGNVFKYQVVGDIRSKKTLLKPHKLSLSKIEDSIVNKPFINLESFYAIALTYNLSISLIQGRKLFEIGRNNDDSKTFVIEKKRGKYGIYLFSSQSSTINIGSKRNISIHALKTAALNYVRDNYWSMENITTPIRPLSAYKLQDLVDICKRLNIPTSHQHKGEFGSIGIEKRKTKGELYEAISQTI